MKIHEYQAKEIFSQFNIPITQEKLCTTVEEVKHAFQELGKAAIKAQVLVGGRGKAGGIQLACSIEEAEEAANRILGMEIKGLTVDKVLVSEAVDIVSESYVGITTDRNAKTQRGGIGTGRRVPRCGRTGKRNFFEKNKSKRQTERCASPFRRAQCRFGFKSAGA